MVNVITFCYYTNERHWYETINIVLIPWLIKIPLVTFALHSVLHSSNLYFNIITILLIRIISNNIKNKAKHLGNVLDSTTGWPFRLYFQFLQFRESKFHWTSISAQHWMIIFYVIQVLHVQNTIVLKIVNRFYFLFVHKCQFTGSVSDWF